MARRLFVLSSAVAIGWTLVACSVEGALAPPADVGPVGSITPPAPVSHMAMARRIPDASASAVSREPMPAAASDGDEGAALAPSSGGQDATYDPTGEGGQPPLADTRHLAEGTVDQPVVAGVGTNDPVALTQGGSGSDANGTQLYDGPRALGAPPSQLHLPPGAERVREDSQDRPVEVAALPRPVNPEVPADATDAPEAAPALPAPAPVAPAPAPQSSWSRPDRPSDETLDGGMPPEQVACRQELKRLGVTWQELPPIHQGGACRIDHPIKLIALSGGIRIKPAATLGCPVTAEFAKWVKTDLAPAARSRYFSGIQSITQLSAYSCRTMNSQRGAPMSEHAQGNAIDVGAVTLNTGRRIDVRKPGWFAFRQRGFLDTVRAESCEHFTTVLGPGTNKYHWNHFHFDLRHRKSGRSYCE